MPRLSTGSKLIAGVTGAAVTVTPIARICAYRQPKCLQHGEEPLSLSEIARIYLRGEPSTQLNGGYMHGPQVPGSFERRFEAIGNGHGLFWIDHCSDLRFSSREKK